MLVVVTNHITAGPDGSFDYVCGSELEGAGFESRSGWMFVIEVVHIQCSELFKSLESAVLSRVVYTKKNP